MDDKTVIRESGVIFRRSHNMDGSYGGVIFWRAYHDDDDSSVMNNDTQQQLNNTRQGRQCATAA